MHVHLYGIHQQRECDWQYFVVVCRYYVIVIDDCFSVDHRRQSPRIITIHSTCRYANYYCATLCLSAVFTVVRCLSVRNGRVLYLDGWRCRQTSFSAGYPHHSSFLTLSADTQYQGEPFVWGVKYTGMGIICDFRQKSLFISKTVQDRPIVAMEL